jgi:hypothetical protein
MIMEDIITNKKLKTICLFFAITMLVACGGGGSDAPDDTANTPTVESFTRLASDFSNDAAARFAVVEQPSIGRIIVSPDLSEITYQAMSGYDFLQPGETAKETVTVSLIGEGNVQHELSFTISGDIDSRVCNNGRSLIYS